jgi:hypothetical protein
MNQEYMFTDSLHKNELSKYKPDKVNAEIKEIMNTNAWILSISIDSESRPSARMLSNINDYIVEAYDCTVLINESSAYFNKVLYPLVNTFERRLRKLLYLASTLNGGNVENDNIEKLEEKDLGYIFELLFTDKDFISKVKTQVNNIPWKFTKEEMLNNIQDIEEKTLWHSYIGEDEVRDLSKSFTDVKSYRNDVMHAHNIGYEKFLKSEKMYETINAQLGLQIDKLTGEKPLDKAEQESNIKWGLFLEETLKIDEIDRTLKEINEKFSSGTYKRIVEAILKDRDLILK